MFVMCLYVTLGAIYLSSVFTFVDAREKSLDDAEAVAVLHSLYAMTTLSQGREGIVNVLVNIDHIPVLLAFIQVTG